jgi:hypothetical protein
MKFLDVKYFLSFLVFFIAFLKEKTSCFKILLKKIKRFAHSKEIFFLEFQDSLKNGPNVFSIKQISFIKFHC